MVGLARPPRSRRGPAPNKLARVWPARDLIPRCLVIVDEGHVRDVDPEEVKAPGLGRPPELRADLIRIAAMPIW